MWCMPSDVSSTKTHVMLAQQNIGNLDGLATNPTQNSKDSKCSIAHYVQAVKHPSDITFRYLYIFAIDAASDLKTVFKKNLETQLVA